MLKGNNFFHKVLHGLAVTPTTLNSGATASVDGATITAPWLYGRQISFILFGGAFAATASVIFKLQGQDLAGSWADIPGNDGVTDLAFAAAVDAGPLEAGTIIGTVDFSRIDATSLLAIRLVATNSAAANALVGAVYVISDLFAHPSGVVDGLFSQQVPA